LLSRSSPIFWNPVRGDLWVENAALLSFFSFVFQRRGGTAKKPQKSNGPRTAICLGYGMTAPLKNKRGGRVWRLPTVQTQMRSGVRPDIRRFIVAKHFKIYYRVLGESRIVEVLRCWDARRGDEPTV